ncbi:MAG: AAA family ATPase [Candidatus Andersenbacteria bacterium]|nr:AAA family ATPase [Candidatus Andersenbacteria bacterium]
MTQQEALVILKTGANVFLTGEPGAGKTHTINEYVSYLKKSGVDVAITASTGIAATHIGGMTIHSWSGIGIKSSLSKYDIDAIASREYIVKRMNRSRVLIIDEVSMLSAGMITMVDAVCKAVKNSEEPFGGLQIIFVGDFFQLPPVSRSAQASQFAYDSLAWQQANPIICYLAEQHRQDDAPFLELLSAIRSNTFDEFHVERLEARRVEAHAAPENIPKLFSHNADVDKVNADILASIPGQAKDFHMYAKGAKNVVESLKKGCLSPEVLSLKVGATVMFTKNNPKEHFVNGTLGVVKEFSKTDGHPVVVTKEGKKVDVESMDWSVEENGRVVASVTQLPLRLAWAITVHKSQGISLDSAVVDLRQVFEFGQGYVALSRVKRLSGLHLLGWNQRAFEVHPSVLEKDAEFRDSSQIAENMFNEMDREELRTMHDNFIKVMGGV